ncbi:hypothetical protein EV421DRAFT_1748585 [Armillaria borealis]|uniref:Uncharacterized protein n=1 Tax=Armillaria borealis TaxID=47425 RepID=A0AA39ID88_9AGAR|nr:hypothetical protein EV421DRAFT_1748585 [Armillaria borealis]
MLPGPAPLLPAVELPVQAAAIQNTEETPLTPTTSRPDTDPHTPTPTSRTATAFGARLNFTQLPTPPDDIGTPPAVSVPASQVLGNHNVSPIQPESQGARLVPVIRPGQENIPILPSTLPNPANRGPLSLDPRTRTSQSLGMGHTAGRMQNLNAFTGSFNFNAPFRPQGVRPEQEIESTGNPIAAIDANGVLGAALEESMSASGDGSGPGTCSHTRKWGIRKSHLGGRERTAGTPYYPRTSSEEGCTRSNEVGSTKGSREEKGRLRC